jgi:hypothetical protein
LLHARIHADPNRTGGTWLEGFRHCDVIDGSCIKIKILIFIFSKGKIFILLEKPKNK